MLSAFWTFISTRARAAGCALGAVLVFVLFIGILSHLDKTRRDIAARQAQQQASAVQAALQERDAFRQQAQALQVSLEGLNTTAQTQAREIARLKAAKPGILQPPQGTTDPCPELRELAVAQDGLIQTQIKALDICAKRGATLEGQASASDRAAQAVTRQVRALQLQIDAMPTDRPWSVGPLVGVNLQGQLRLGVIASGSYRRIQGHALVLGDTVAAGVTYRFGGGK